MENIRRRLFLFVQGKKTYMSANLANDSNTSRQIKDTGLLDTQRDPLRGSCFSMASDVYDNLRRQDDGSYQYCCCDGKWLPA